MAGFSLGLLHAFDADHVMAVSTLSSRKPSLKRTLLFSTQWALGHGGVLMLCGVLLFGLGLQLPEAFIQFAESSVGVLLIVIGVMCLHQCRKQKLILVTHQHGDVKHTHWCLDDVEHTKKNEHTPTFVGMLHGLAGSAPALAVVPMVGQAQLSTAMLYLALFSLGVLLSMASFGLGLGSIQKKLKALDVRVFQGSRYLIAVASILLGGYWLTA
jgi:sulfite exporter TauE/SafE